MGALLKLMAVIAIHRNTVFFNIYYNQKMISNVGYCDLWLVTLSFTEKNPHCYFSFFLSNFIL